MRPRPFVAILVVSLIWTGCGMSQEDRDKLSFYRENSALYYDAGRFVQAIGLIEKGLEIAPNDYKLLATRAWCNLRRVDQSPDFLDVCEQQFEDLWATRDPEDHGVPVLLGQGVTQKRLGLRHWERTRALRSDAETKDRTESERALLEAEASEHEVAADYHFDKAERAIQQLLDNELALRTANQQMMEIAAARNDYDRAVVYGLKFLDYNNREQQELLTRIEETLDVQIERAARARYQDILEDETRVRSALAEMHYRRSDYVASLAQLDSLIELDPTRSTDYYNRARVLETLGRIEPARRDYEKFLSSTKLPVGNEKVTHAFEFTRKYRPDVPQDG